MDAADITAMHDFNDESVRRALATNQPTLVRRGTCLYCDEQISNHLIYCDSDCQQGYEEQQAILKRTRK